MITISRAGVKLRGQRLFFPGGEVQIKLDVNNYAFMDLNGPITLSARINASTDVLDLVLTVDALRRMIPEAQLRLFMPYCPYARQDRVCVPGEALSIKAFANIINGLGFSSVVICDPHSDVTPAVINNVKVITQVDIFNRYEQLLQFATLSMLVCPDAGAIKKTIALCNYMNHSGFIQAEKIRDLETGEIKETKIRAEGIEGKSVLIVDDICDGGRTFIELAKVLKAKGVDHIGLYVTHGIFSKGTKPLTEAGISRIYTTDSFYDTWPQGIGNVFTLGLEQAFGIK